MPSPGRLKPAISTLYEEVFQFRFNYPLAIVPEAGPKDSLHYYVFKYRKTPPYRQVLRLDPDGIAQVWGRTTGVVYRPGFVATYALHNLEQHLRTGDPHCLGLFLKQVKWLEAHAVLRRDGAVVWEHDFDIQEGPVRLRAPWVSANSQGLAISALVRAWRLTGQPHLMDLLERSIRVFQLDYDCGGVRVRTGSHTLYAEIPGLASPGILDGFLRSLLGLYDLYEETDNDVVWSLFQDGIEGLHHFLPQWDYRRKWSMYSNRYYLCPSGYHCLNRLLLMVLARLTGDSRLAEFAAAWDQRRLSLLDRIEVYLAFLWTKNACRIKHNVWKQAKKEERHEQEPSSIKLPSQSVAPSHTPTIREI